MKWPSRGRGAVPSQGLLHHLWDSRNHNDAEDIAQQVFAKIYFSIQSFDFRSSLLTWIYKITVNECYDYLRKKRVRKLVLRERFSEEDAQRMPNSETATGQAPAVDTNWRGRPGDEAAGQTVE